MKDIVDNKKNSLNSSPLGSNKKQQRWAVYLTPKTLSQKKAKERKQL